nr:MAG TPA: hypothetical protein [Caudoviricetes sp.]
MLLCKVAWFKYTVWNLCEIFKRINLCRCQSVPILCIWVKFIIIQPIFLHLPIKLILGKFSFCYH